MSHYFYWDPDRVLFTVPLIDRPVVWYGMFFVIGFFFSYLTMLVFFRNFLQTIPALKAKANELSLLLTDRLSWCAISGVVIGARLGEVFFYNWDYYREHPDKIIRIWDGGLASHGGVIGALLAIALYHRYQKKIVPQISFLRLLDLCCIPAAFLCMCIRIGNFFNQEIIGTETTLPWAVIFGHPADGSASVPRHPVQLYEAFCYLLIYIFLALLWRAKGTQLKPGFYVGLSFILALGTRFFIEFLKAPMEASVDQSFLQMGQLLSLPFILLGVFLCLPYCCKKNLTTIQK